jgi:hypothetical protein
MSVSVQRPRRLEPAEIERLDPYVFMAVIGKRVIHPGGRAAHIVVSGEKPLA